MQRNVNVNGNKINFHSGENTSLSSAYWKQFSSGSFHTLVRFWHFLCILRPLPCILRQDIPLDFYNTASFARQRKAFPWRCRRLSSTVATDVQLQVQPQVQLFKHHKLLPLQVFSPFDSFESFFSVTEEFKFHNKQSEKLTKANVKLTWGHVKTSALRCAPRRNLRSASQSEDLPLYSRRWDLWDLLEKSMLKPFEKVLPRLYQTDRFK